MEKREVDRDGAGLNWQVDAGGLEQGEGRAVAVSGADMARRMRPDRTGVWAEASVWPDAE